MHFQPRPLSKNNGGTLSSAILTFDVHLYIGFQHLFMWFKKSEMLSSPAIRWKIKK